MVRSTFGSCLTPVGRDGGLPCANNGPEHLQQAVASPQRLSRCRALRSKPVCSVTRGNAAAPFSQHGLDEDLRTPGRGSLQSENGRTLTEISQREKNVAELGKVLVLSASAGAGHLRAAQAVERALIGVGAVRDVRHIDVLEYTNKVFRNFYSKAY